MKTTDVILICEALNIQVTPAFGSVVGKKKKIYIQNPYKSEPLSSSPITFLPTTAAKNGMFLDSLPDILRSHKNFQKSFLPFGYLSYLSNWP